jgi:hypothetical protein
VKPRRRRIVRVLLGLLVVATAGVSYAVYRHEHEDDRVRRAADRLSAPAGWTLVDVTKDSNSPFLCIVSCFHAQVVKIYRTDATPSQACDTLETQIECQISMPERRTGMTGCGWHAPLRGVGSRADVWAYTETAAEVRREPLDQRPGTSTSIADGTYVWVTFSGGPT